MNNDEKDKDTSASSGNIISTLSKGSSGLEMQKYLYETGLQNIFNEYNKQIGNLDQSRQKEIEDAYYIRELSKKYTAEYASNAGIGDVSGQLLDIYGNYQKNINEINANFGQLKAGLESSYQTTKQEYEMGLLQTQKSIEDEQLQKQQESKIAEIQHNIATGLLPEGMDMESYLNAERETLGEANYWALMTQNKLTTMEKVSQEALGAASSYETQEEYDRYIDDLVSSKSISKERGNELKNMYVEQRKTNFTINESMKFGEGVTYYNPPSSGIKANGKVYTSADGEFHIAETNNVVSEGSSTYKKMDEKYGSNPYDMPFSHDGKWFVKQTLNGEDVYVEYAKANVTTSTKTSTVTKDSDYYKELEKEIGVGKGSVSDTTGRYAYSYDEETESYKKYLDFNVKSVGGEKIDVSIGGQDFYIDKKDPANRDGHGVRDLKDMYGYGEKYDDKKTSPTVRGIVDVFMEEYFGGDEKGFIEYVNNSRKFFGNAVGKGEVIIVSYNNEYYTINDGELWKLSVKK